MRGTLALAVGLVGGLIIGYSADTAWAQEPEAPQEASPLEAFELPAVEVIEHTPLPALGIPIEKYPGNVQEMAAEEVESQNPHDLSNMLYRNLGSVNINAAQNNPWQSDVTYRGFLASPLTGSPIGLSVYMDGMRFNDGFGETVNWDLIPQSAIAEIDLIPGSNPVFGLNTLGGALNIRTKRGFDFQGTEIEASGGSFGRWAVEAEHGVARGPFDLYLTFNALDEHGWREHSPSDLRQLFSRIGYKTDRTDLNLNYIWADNDLIGNGFVPTSTLKRDRDAVHTFPDLTENRMHLLNLRGSRRITDTLLLSGNGFYRYYKRKTLNGDAEVGCMDDATGEEVFDAGGRPLHLGLCAGLAVGFFDEDGNPLTGALEREAEGEDRTTRTRTDDFGGTLQLSHSGAIMGRTNRLTVGFAFDRHESHFSQREAESELVPDGNSVGTEREEPFETEVNVGTRQDNAGVYITNTVDITERLALTLSGRYQHVDIRLRDRSGENDDLNGHHTFERFSPAVGLTFQALKNATLFFSYSEGFRAPTPAELTCADENDPCNLPNAFVADPPLNKVVARTYEFGTRGSLPIGNGLRWNAGFFRTDLSNDILFTVVETGGAGFFRNVDATRRQGVEVGLQGRWQRLRYFGSYAYVDATYQSDVTLASVTESDGVRVKDGDQIPGIPTHNAKVGAEYALLDNLWIGGNVIAVSGNYLRGDDGNNQSKTDAYAILNLHARYVPIKNLEIWTRIDNVTDTHYETAGALNFNAFSSPIAVERFVAPGSPVAGWVGVKLRF
ncbi:TonB-dependent siderophore receptor [Candidatus Methylomirabilis lanthanidiphila]|uniref:TonB-dependent siderophore receptor n=1 Tax=Candidatus Methylomirabilis lanthanidiphila TaxID=2211376 RepID=A0A564ZGV0_9BACT|nr:TonB-dependent siderophore receptor [Candidatus Methylomirabilis lanthanidiphila]